MGCPECEPGDVDVFGKGDARCSLCGGGFVPFASVERELGVTRAKIAERAADGPKCPCCSAPFRAFPAAGEVFHACLDCDAVWSPPGGVDRASAIVAKARAAAPPPAGAPAPAAARAGPGPLPSLAKAASPIPDPRASSSSSKLNDPSSAIRTASSSSSSPPSKLNDPSSTIRTASSSSPSKLNDPSSTVRTSSSASSSKLTDPSASIRTAPSKLNEPSASTSRPRDSSSKPNDQTAAARTSKSTDPSTGAERTDSGSPSKRARQAQREELEQLRIVVTRTLPWKSAVAAVVVVIALVIGWSLRPLPRVDVGGGKKVVVPWTEAPSRTAVTAAGVTGTRVTWQHNGASLEAIHVAGATTQSPSPAAVVAALYRPVPLTPGTTAAQPSTGFGVLGPGVVGRVTVWAIGRDLWILSALRADDGTFASSPGAAAFLGSLR